MSFNHLKLKITSLASSLEDEFNESEFDSGKEELLGLLDLAIHDHGSIDLHYDDSVRLVLSRVSQSDTRLDERIMKGTFIMKEAALEGDVGRVKSCLRLLIDLEHRQLNRRWGHRGIYYEKNCTFSG
jgi:hypothetical protein